MRITRPPSSSTATRSGAGRPACRPRACSSAVSRPSDAASVKLSPKISTVPTFWSRIRCLSPSVTPGPPKLASIICPTAMSSDKAAGRGSTGCPSVGAGLAEAPRLGGGFVSAAAMNRGVRAGHKDAGYGQHNQEQHQRGVDQRAPSGGAPRLVLEDAPYERLEDGFKQTENEAEDQEEDEVHEEHTRDDDPDQEALREPLHVES